MVEYMYYWFLFEVFLSSRFPSILSSCCSSVPCIISTLWFWYFKWGMMGNASLIRIRITGVLSVFKLNNRLTAAACHVRKTQFEAEKSWLESNLTLHVPHIPHILWWVELDWPTRNMGIQRNSTRVYVSHPHGNDSSADAFRGQLQDQTNLTLCASLSWILAWRKFNEKPRRHRQFLTAWFAGLHNRHSWYRLDDELQEIRVTHTVSRRQYTTISLWQVHVSDLSVAPKQTVVIVTSRKSLEILSSSMHVYAAFVAARPLPSHCRWCLMLPHQEWSSYPWGFWPCSWAVENMATSLYDASLWHVASPTNSCLAP